MKNSLLLLSLKYILDEYKENSSNIFSLAVQNMRQQTLRTSLGIGWVFVRDVVFYFIFILFRFLVAGAENIDGMSFILYMMIGMVAWNFMNEVINGGIMAIKHNKHILSSIKFPISILPTVEVLAIFLKRMFTLIILLIVILIFGDIRSVSPILFIYYFLSMTLFMICWNLVFTSLVAVSNDFEQLYRAITSIIFYTLPIFWSFEFILQYPVLSNILKMNPFVYIVDGFKDAIVYGNMPDLRYTLYFWTLNLVLLILGSILQFKLKRHYIDLI